MFTENLADITPDEARERLVSPAPVLISEHEVALGTVTALRTRPRRRWFEATHGLLAAVQRSFAASPHGDRPVKREYPKHYAFLENACMAREMERL